MVPRLVSWIFVFIYIGKQGKTVYIKGAKKLTEKEKERQIDVKKSDIEGKNCIVKVLLNYCA